MPTIEVGEEDRRQLQDIADLLAKSKKVVVVTGAGISTNSGIPDFRSENGLYALIQAQYDAAAQSKSNLLTPESTRSGTPMSIDLEQCTPESSQPSSTSSSCRRSSLPANMKGRDLFDSLIWTNPLSASIFYTFIASLRKKIRDEINDTTPTHKFIRALRDGGRLVRCYTQNIDGLEARDGLCLDLKRGKGNRSRFTKNVVSKPRPDGPILPGSEADGGCEVVQLHGDLEALRCSLCNELCSWEEEDRESTLLSGKAPGCNLCAFKSDNRRSSGKRGTAVGGLRPNIVLYGEEHPSANLLGPITTHDLTLGPDVLIIMGTSLRVHGLKVMVKEFAKAVHAQKHGKGKVILVNRTKPAESVWSNVIDYWVAMDCDDWVTDLRNKRGDIWERQGALKLPVVKEVKQKPDKSKPTKPKREKVKIEKSKPNKERVTRNTKEDENKENAAGKSKKMAPKRVRTTKRQPAKRVIFSKAITKALKAKVQKEKPTRQPLSPQQLPTPPVTPSKRLSPSSYDEDTLVASPSKRSKGTIEVWVDNEGKKNLQGAPLNSAEMEPTIIVKIPGASGRRSSRRPVPSKTRVKAQMVT